MENDVKDLSTPKKSVEISSEDLSEISENIDPIIRQAVIAAISHVSEYTFSGPLPPPQVLEGYEKAFPGFSNRILVAFEADLAHIQSMDKIRLEASISTTSRGQRDGFVFGIIGLVAGVFIASLGLILGTTGPAIAASISGSILGGLSIFRLVSKYIDGPSVRNRPPKNSENKK